jgi:D-glycero-alpha-D-manno-heptose-7-phosphate kinase
MIVTRTPLRVSLFGGGTDYPDWYRNYGGSVLGFAINRYIYISMRHLPPFFDHKHRIVYSKIENVRTFSEIQHPAVRAILMELAEDTGLEIHHDSDLPARSGLGSSSSFTVGLINALMALKGRMMTKEALASEALRIEQEVIGEAVGSQDQTWAAYGGINRIEFQTTGDITVSPLIVSRERRDHLLGNLMLFFTGVSRFAVEVAQQKINNIKDQSANLKDLHGLVKQAESVIASHSDLDELGRMLHESWMIKRGLAKAVSNDVIDAIYTSARNAGAIGGKLLGAGGGGFVLFYVQPEHQQNVRESLSELVEVDFSIDYAGSTVMIYEPDGLSHR